MRMQGVVKEKERKNEKGGERETDKGRKPCGSTAVLPMSKSLIILHTSKAAVFSLNEGYAVTAPPK